MVFLDHVQNLHIHAEKTHKDFGAHCMKYVNFVHDPEKQYRSTVPAVRPLLIGLQVTEHVHPPVPRYMLVLVGILLVGSYDLRNATRPQNIRNLQPDLEA